MDPLEFLWDQNRPILSEINMYNCGALATFHLDYHHSYTWTPPADWSDLATTNACTH